MKKYFGYGLFILIGVLGMVALILRCDAINNNVSQESNVVEIFA